MKKASILLSVYKPNKADLIKQLKSLDNQTYKDVELLIHDDCPSDRCDIGIFKKNLKKIPFKVLPYLDHNLGYTKSFERLTSSVKHNGYVLFCDQDDVWYPDKTSETIKAAEENDAVLVACDREKIDENDNTTCKSVWHTSSQRYLCWNTGDKIAKYNVFNCFSPGMCLTAKASFAKKCIPFCETTGHDLWIIACACMEGKIYRLDKVLIKNRRHSTNVSGFLSGVSSKKDYVKRIKDQDQIVEDLKKKYPNYEDIKYIDDFSKARLHKNIFKMYKYRDLNPKFTLFEIYMYLVPEFLFKKTLKLIRKKYDY